MRGSQNGCIQCGSPIERRWQARQRKYCSDRCMWRANGYRPITPPLRECTGCGQSFTPQPRQVRCRKDCRRDKRKAYSKPCAHCGTEYRPKTDTSRFCSNRCGALARGKRGSKYGGPRPCPVCGQIMEPVDASWHPRRYCSRECAIRAPRAPKTLTQEELELRSQRRQASRARQSEKRKLAYHTDTLERERQKLAFRTRYQAQRDRYISKAKRWKDANRDRYNQYMREWSMRRRAEALAERITYPKIMSDADWTRQPNRRLDPVLAGIPCPGCGEAVKAPHVVFCSASCEKREANPLRRVGISFQGLLREVCAGRVSADEVIAFIGEWRAYRGARRAVNLVLTGETA